MKVSKIYYKRLFNLGNYQNEEIGVEIKLDKGDTANEAFEAAKSYVMRRNSSSELEQSYKSALKVLSDKENHTYKEVKDAEKIVDEYEYINNTSLPF